MADEAQIIDGKSIARAIRGEVADSVAALVAKGHRPPGLAVVLVGDDPASAAYVRSKGRACEEAGIYSVQETLLPTTTQQELLGVIDRLNCDLRIHGILVQLPLPKHINEQSIVEAISPAKDVDGFHPLNVGRLAGGMECFVPCTPLGVRELLIRSGIQTQGARAVVIGRSNIVGLPMAQLLMGRGEGGDATVTVCHSRTADLSELTRQADILIAAIGRAGFVTGDMIKPGATVIDVGINRVDDAEAEKGYRLVGDVDFDSARQVAGAITPVPGGVGPMTIAMLLRNTLESAQTWARADVRG